MSVDAFTFVAQVVNFLILAALLRWFLYDPIVQAMQEREQKIAAQIAEAQQAQQEGDARAEQYVQRLRALDEQRESTLREARQQAEAQRIALTNEARNEVQQRRREWLQEFDRERSAVLSELQRGAGRLTADATRRTLQELADESLEQRTLAVFSARLDALDEQRKADLRSALDAGPVIVRTAFDVSDPWRQRLEASLGETLGRSDAVDFETAPDLICGIEVVAGGHGLGWNVDDFLREMSTEFEERLKARIGKDPA